MNNNTIEAFTQEIEVLSCKLNLGIMDAIVHYCDSNKIEIEAVIPLISKKLKDRIHTEALSLRLIREDSKSQKLPLL